MAASSDDEDLEDAAILLMSLGEEQAADVLKLLAPKEVQRLGETIARLTSVPRQRVDGVIERFTESAGNTSTLVNDNTEYVRNVLRRALGDDTADLILERITHGGDVSGIEGLKWMDPSSVAELLRNEHPQIIAAIVAHLDVDHTAGVLKMFSERLRNEVLIRVATLDGIQPAALADLNDVLRRLVAGGERTRKSNLGGVKAAAEILNQLGSAIEVTVLDYVREADQDLAQEIADNMFTFDDLNRLDDRAIQTLLREVQTDSLVLALKGATPALRDKVFRNMSKRAAESLREDLESRGPVRLAEVEAEQKAILKVVRRLSDDGVIAMAGGGDEQFV